PLAEPLAAESEIGFSAAHLTVLLAELQEGILLAGADGKILHLNPKAEKLLNRPLAQCLGQDAGEVFRLVHLQNGQPGENPVAKALSSAEATGLNAEFALDTGATVAQPVVFSTRPVIDASGRPSGAVVVFR
ncbi:MAG: PAS domain-containing protein, partial [Oleiharenicola lentus]